MQKITFLAFSCLTALSLSSCADVQRDINTSYNSSANALQQAFSNLKPFDATQPAAPETKVAAVESTSTTGPNCPNVRIVNDLNQVHQFVDATKPAPGQAISSIRMQSVETKCQMVRNNVVIDMTLAFDGDVGPKGRAVPGDKPSFAYPYFVAITNNQGSIIGKEVFAATLVYDGGRNHETHVEQVRQMIPMNDKDYKNYKVLIGFQLNDQELAFNRSLPQNVSETSIEPASGSSVIVTPESNSDRND